MADLFWLKRTEFRGRRMLGLLWERKEHQARSSVGTTTARDVMWSPHGEQILGREHLP